MRPLVLCKTRYATMAQRSITMKCGVLLLFLLPLSLSAEFTHDNISQAKRVNHLALQCHFDSALVVCDSLIKDDGDPFYYYLKLSALGLYSLDHMSVQREQELLKLLEREGELFSQPTTVDEKRLVAFWQIASSSFVALEKHYLSAYHKGKKGLKVIKEYQDSAGVLKYDALYYIGNEGYLKNEMRRRSGGLLFWYKKAGEQGVSSLEKSADSASFMQVSAQFSLIDYAISLGEYGRAQKLIDSVPEKFHTSRFYYWPKLRLAEAQKDTVGIQREIDVLVQSYYKDEAHKAVFTCLERGMPYFNPKTKLYYQRWLEVAYEALALNEEEKKYHSRLKKKMSK